MKCIGVIGEYNPFHSGHRYLFEQARAMTGADLLVTVMSGDFTQRGMPAIEDKWERAKAAVAGGANIVCELPVCYAVSSAEFFAQGGVRILEGFGCIDYLAFGSENGEISSLSSAARFIEEHGSRINQRASEILRDGLSYPAARSAAIREIDPSFDEDLIREPNNILGIEYIRQLRRMKAVTFRRSEGYHQSASDLRRQMSCQDKERVAVMQSQYYDLVRTGILTSDRDALDCLFSASGGLGSKLKKEVRYSISIDDLTDRVKSKVYTRTRISRLLTQVLLGIDRESVELARPYIRILAADREGTRLLKRIKKQELNEIPILTNINRELSDYPHILPTLNKDILASDLYNIIAGKDLYENSDYVRKPYIAGRDLSV